MERLISLSLIYKYTLVNPDFIPHLRERLRRCLAFLGVKETVVGPELWKLSWFSQEQSPLMVEVRLAADGKSLTMSAGGAVLLSASCDRALGGDDIECVRSIMGQLSREELMLNLERQVNERTEELEIERQRSESLLKDLLPTTILNKLKNGEAVTEKYIGTVLFADIVGFTNVASELSPIDIAEFLEHAFSGIDDIIYRHGLEKIKTIGDCYMAAGGFNPDQDDHADCALRSALDVISVSSRLGYGTRPNITFRIGIHTGPFVAGVLDGRRRAFDIWGDTVNVASRMESHGEPGKIQISEDVRLALKGQFLLEDRGYIEIKNHGSMRTWYVNVT